ncbi:MAG: hypothetical protein Q8P22_08565 [Chloroflexota bacterium]|nr:hypothetical protein [Chloroflexota bacterium]
MVAEIWVGQFSIVGGEAREQGPWVGMFPPTSRGLGSDIYVLVEPSALGSEDFCQPLVAVIGRLFRQQRLSLTGALLASLRAAHNHLRDWNEKSLREHRVGAGASCLALRGAEAYLAQAGPALAYCRQQGQLLVLSPQEAEAAEPIGIAEEFYPTFSCYQVAAGDVLLLATSSLASVADEEAMAALLAREPQDILPELYLRVRHLPDFAALLVAFLPVSQP